MPAGGETLTTNAALPTRAAAPRDAGRRWLATGAGMVSAGVALSIGELMSGVTDRVTSLVIGVAEAMVDWTPGFIARWSIDLFGRHQKTLLVWGIVIISMLVAAAVGRIGLRNRGAIPAVFGAFGVVGGITAARVPGASASLAWLSAILAAIAGGALLYFLVQLLVADSPTSAATPVQREGHRRQFMKLAGSASLGAVAAWMGGDWLRNRFNVNAAREEAAAAISLQSESAARATAVPPTAVPATAVAGETAVAEAAVAETVVTESALVPASTSASFDAVVPGITPLVVPNDEFYRIDTAIVVPQVDPSSWSLKINGMVDTPLEFSFQDLLDRASVEESVTLSCVSNPVGGDLVGNAVWLGVPLTDLLEEAGVQPGATQIFSRSVDGWSCGFPSSVLDDPDRVALVAIAMNGEPLPTAHGFPARLVVSGLYGYVSATKWVSEIELTGWEDEDGYWIPRGWSKLGPVKTQSRVDVPRNGTTIEPGPHVIAGVAWAPHTGIDMVEVSIDGGEWQVAELIIEQSVHSWRQWKLDWDATPGQHAIAVRASDSSGYTQVPERTNVAPDGATGHHTINVRVA